MPAESLSLLERNSMRSIENCDNVVRLSFIASGIVYLAALCGCSVSHWGSCVLDGNRGITYCNEPVIESAESERGGDLDSVLEE